MYVFDYNKLSVYGEKLSLRDLLDSMIAQVNESADEPITGLLLLYNKYGINMIEVKTCVYSIINLK